MNNCLGCGSKLQSIDSSKEGYIRENNISSKLCERCFRIRNYGEYKTVVKDNNDFEPILKKIGTTNSLVILDEIGRGTSTYDGLSIAWAVAEYISDKEKCGAKTLFATHYHELTELEEKLEGVKNYNIAVKEKGEDIIFLRKILRGGTDESYGIHVARLANLPESLIKRASQILAVYENKEKVRDNKIQESLPLEELMEPKENEIQKVIDEINPLEITPLEALNILYDLKNKIRR